MTLYAIHSPTLGYANLIDQPAVYTEREWAERKLQQVLEQMPKRERKKHDWRIVELTPPEPRR